MTWWCGKRPTSLCLRPTVCLGHSPDLKPMACRLNFGALPSPLPRTLRKGSRNAQKQTNSVFTTSHKVPSKNLDTILILARDLEYGDVSELNQLPEEVSKLLEAYSQVVLNSVS